MNKEDLKSKIVEANKAYRLGKPTISDQEYDFLVEEFEKSYPNEYDEFRDTLNEGMVEHGTKIKHPFIMGSLDKIKNTDQKTFSSYLKKYVKTKLNISAKVDGISCRIRYVNGVIESASTRGDGFEGVVITDKIKYVKGVPEAISYSEPIDVRGELVIFNSEDIESTTNLRNICSGYIGRKDWNKDDISKVSFVPYIILGDQFTKNEQFELLEELGFNPAWHKNIDVSEATLDNLTNYAKLEHEYQCDGLVLIDENAKNENAKRPKNSMAFKINEISGISKIIDVSWEGPSANGRFVPVAVIEPIVLGEATICRASMHNLDVMEKLGAKYGSEVLVTKNNDIIPQIAKVLSNSTNNTSDIELPSVCPSCGSTLIKDSDGLYMVCKNPNCKTQIITRLAEFIKKLGVMHASEKTLDNFGIHSFDMLLKFKADPKYKSQVTLEDEIYNKIFSRSKVELLYAMNFDDIAKLTLEKIVNHYGFNNIEGYIFPDEYGNLSIRNGFGEFLRKSGLPVGVGEITLNKFKNGFLDAFKKIYKITSDIRWHYSESSFGSSSSIKKTIGSICVTGSLNFGSRSKFLEYAKEHGYESKSGVSKGLTYLVNNDISSNSSKNKKAKELGIKIISEADFLKIIKDDTIEQDLNDL